MNTINKAELAQKYNSVDEALSKSKEEKANKTFAYATMTKYIKEIGYVHQMTMEQVLLTKRFLDKNTGNSFDAEMKALGINASEVSLKESTSYLGISNSVWESDLKTRIEELRLEKRILNLQNDKKLLHKYLDGDAKMQLDFMNLSGEQV